MQLQTVTVTSGKTKSVRISSGKQSVTESVRPTSHTVHALMRATATTVEQRRTLFTSASVADESSADICTSKLFEAGKAMALLVLRRARQVADFSELVVPTGDGGITLEFASPTTGREVMFALPDDGTRLYFSAKADGRGFRRAGITLDQEGIIALAEWVAGSSNSFPEEGLQLG